jgi:hypothetical protein
MAHGNRLTRSLRLRERDLGQSELCGRTERVWVRVGCNQGIALQFAKTHGSYQGPPSGVQKGPSTHYDFRGRLFYRRTIIPATSFSNATYRDSSSAERQ